MKETYSVFRRYPTIFQAKELEDLLNQSNIDTQLTDNIAPVDASFSGSTLLNEYEIKIQFEDFEKAELILENEAENLIDQVDSNHYLFDFTDDELYDILLKADEWSEFDYKLAQKILTRRGKSIDGNLLKALKKQRIESLTGTFIIKQTIVFQRNTSYIRRNKPRNCSKSVKNGVFL